MNNDEPWLMRIEGALSAHFLQPDGPSRPGTDWSVGLKRGEQVCQVTVRAYLSEDMTRRARADTQYQGETVLGYLSELLARGWSPEQPGELSITIQNPTGETTPPTGHSARNEGGVKAWWRFW